MRTYFVERGKLLNQQVLKNTSGIDFIPVCELLVSAVSRPEGIYAGSAHSLRIFEIGRFSIQDVEIPGLVNVQLCSHKGPEGVIHPDAGNAVAVRDKIPVSVPDNGGVGAVDTDPAVVCFYHLPHILRLHQKQRQAVLP